MPTNTPLRCAVNLLAEISIGANPSAQRKLRQSDKVRLIVAKFSGSRHTLQGLVEMSGHTYVLRECKRRKITTETFLGEGRLLAPLPIR